jgi:hypothetical protein
MDDDWDTRDQGALQAAYRTHLRDMTAARQAAERARGTCSHDPLVRQETDAAFKQELARIAAVHQAWLHAHGIADPPERGRYR